MGFVSHFVLPLRTFSRVVMAMMVRFSFRAIEGVSNLVALKAAHPPRANTHWRRHRAAPRVI
jgi:hypothetical protein